MKHLKLFPMAMAAACLSLTIAIARGDVTYLSNLADATWAGYGVNSNFALGQPFQTGFSAGGYSLSSITVPMLNGDASVSAFQLSICSDASGMPGKPLEILTGDSDPQLEGLYTYASSGLILQPDTTYWIVARASGGTTGFDAYFWGMTREQNFVSSDGWQIPFGNTFGIYEAADNQWHLYPSNTYGTFKFSVDAESVPEPNSLAFLALGGAGLLALRKWRA